MKYLMALLVFKINICSIISQNINLSNGIGELSRDYTYEKLIITLGTPDSTYSFDPKNQNPVPKSSAYTELYYDNNMFIVKYSYFMLDTLVKKSVIYSIEILNGSTIKLNGDSVSNLDSAYVVKKYNTPESILKSKEELIINYSFPEKKYFSLLTFYFGMEGTIKKVRIYFGKYL